MGPPSSPLHQPGGTPPLKRDLPLFPTCAQCSPCSSLGPSQRDPWSRTAQRPPQSSSPGSPRSSISHCSLCPSLKRRFPPDRREKRERERETACFRFSVPETGRRTNSESRTQFFFSFILLFFFLIRNLYGTGRDLLFNKSDDGVRGDNAHPAHTARPICVCVCVSHFFFFF